jgi:hypothetical protein
MAIPKRVLRPVALRLSINFALILLLLIPVIAKADHFVAGELYLVTVAYPAEAPTTLVRIDSVTGAKTVLLAGSALQPYISYDPFRDRVIGRAGSGDLFEVDHDGSVTTTAIAVPNGGVLAPDGVGRIYFATATSPVEIWAIDASNTAHQIMQSDGITPYTRPVLPQAMIFDAPSNSLLMGHGTSLTTVVKAPLGPGGFQLTGAESSAAYDANAGIEAVVGMSAGPGGEVMIKIDTNTNLSELRLFTIDPVTLAFADWAVTGGTAVAAETAGTYVTTIGQVVVQNTGTNELRVMAQLLIPQSGTLLTSGVSTVNGSSEATELIAIGNTIAGFVAQPVPALGPIGAIALTGGLLGVACKRLGRRGRAQRERSTR